MKRSIAENKNLWRSVFTLAVKDLFSSIRSERLSAMAWLFDEEQAKIRREVCELADVNIEAWRREMLMVVEKVAQRNMGD